MEIHGPPYPALAIANYYIGNAKEPVSPMKMQKLVYFAHGWHLAIKEKPLINEVIQAWTYGPVIQILYDKFKKYGSGHIKENASFLDVVDGEMVFDEYLISPEDKDTTEFLEEVWKVYGPLDAFRLSNITHYEGSPWYNVMFPSDGHEMRVSSAPISNKSIMDYFKQVSSEG